MQSSRLLLGMLKLRARRNIAKFATIVRSLFSNDIFELGLGYGCREGCALEPGLRLLFVRVRQSNEIKLAESGPKETESDWDARCGIYRRWPIRDYSLVVWVKSEGYCSNTSVE